MLGVVSEVCRRRARFGSGFLPSVRRTIARRQNERAHAGQFPRSMRALAGAVVAVLAAGMAGPPALSQQPVPCSESPLAVSLQGFSVDCSKSTMSQAEYDAALASAAKEGDWAQDLLKALRPPNAETYSVSFGIVEKEMGQAVLSIANSGHAVDAVDVQRAAEGFARLADAMFGGTTEFDWSSESAHADYSVHPYVMSFEDKPSMFPSDPRSCFAFVRYLPRTADQTYSHRLWGFYCRGGSKRLDDAAIKRVLAAISMPWLRLCRTRAAWLRA